MYSMKKQIEIPDELCKQLEKAAVAKFGLYGAITSAVNEAIRTWVANSGTVTIGPAIGGVVCDACGHSLTDENGASVIGIHLELKGDFAEHPEATRVRELFGKLEFDTCYVCWLRSLGVPETKQPAREDP